MCMAVQVVPELKVNPYVTTYEGETVLVLAHDLFVILNNYEQFVVIRNVRNHTAIKAAPFRLDRMQTVPIGSNSILMRELYYMNCISAGAGIPEFDDLMKTNPTFVDSFVTQAWKKFHQATYDVTFNDMKYEAHKNNVPTTLANRYYVPYVGNALLSLDISDDKIMVKVETVAGARWLTLPYIDDVKNCLISLYSKAHAIPKGTCITDMALNMVGDVDLDINERLGVSLIQNAMDELNSASVDSMDISNEIYAVCLNTTEAIYDKAIDMEEI